MTDPGTRLIPLFKALGDELRLRLLQVLGRDSYGVMELAEGFDVTQSGMSHHLKILAAAGLVDTRREGNSIFYRRLPLPPDAPHAAIAQALYGQLDGAPLPAAITAGLAAVNRARTLRSERFFLENAHKLEVQQDLIAAHSVYSAAALAAAAASAPARRRALEVGPGAGELLPGLCELFEHVTALDNSAEMLQRARQHCEALPAGRVEFILGTPQHLSVGDAPFDCAVMNMVLHHTETPADVMEQVAQALAPGGALVITELCAHTQAWARDACGDVWLGFAPADLAEWAQRAGLAQGQSSYLALRNGFQIQIQQYHKP